jgi:hypothetical protein
VAVRLYNPPQYQITMSKTTIGIIITAISLLSLLSVTIALQTQSVDAATGNATQQANQTGEKMQSGMTNATQESKSAANQTGEKGQSMLNKTGETLQQINPFK